KPQSIRIFDRKAACQDENEDEQDHERSKDDDAANRIHGRLPAGKLPGESAGGSGTDEHAAALYTRRRERAIAGPWIDGRYTHHGAPDKASRPSKPRQNRLKPLAAG